MKFPLKFQILIISISKFVISIISWTEWYCPSTAWFLRGTIGISFVIWERIVYVNSYSDRIIVCNCKDNSMEKTNTNIWKLSTICYWMTVFGLSARITATTIWWCASLFYLTTYCDYYWCYYCSICDYLYYYIECWYCC